MYMLEETEIVVAVSPFILCFTSKLCYLMAEARNESFHVIGAIEYSVHQRKEKQTIYCYERFETVRVRSESIRKFHATGSNPNTVHTVQSSKLDRL